jgi:hypothetical protein
MRELRSARAVVLTVQLTAQDHLIGRQQHGLLEVHIRRAILLDGLTWTDACDVGSLSSSSSHLFRLVLGTSAGQYGSCRLLMVGQVVN